MILPYPQTSRNTAELPRTSAAQWLRSGPLRLYSTTSNRENRSGNALGETRNPPAVYGWRSRRYQVPD